MNRKHVLHIDIETRSSADISSTGNYKYARDKDFTILLIAYAVDDEPVKLIDLTGTPDPFEVAWLKNALQNPDYLKMAYNAAFEWYCFHQYRWATPIEQWRCTMVHAAYCGYPVGLEATGNAIGLPQDKKKLMTGKALIRYFCTPQKATKKNGGRKYNEPHHDPEKWKLFWEYCMQDVEAEREIENMLTRYPVPEDEWELWRRETLMNADGVRVDRELVEGALYCAAVTNEELMEESKRITGLDNPNSSVQLLAWFEQQGVELPNMQKETVAEALTKNMFADHKRVLEIRQQLGKTSVKKYDAMQNMLCEDGRIRGLMQFYGANRTGRWAGRGVQIQNLTKHHVRTVDEARNLIKTGNVDAVKMLYGNVRDLLSQLIRTAFIASPGNKLVVADFSAIEARVIAWLAREKWVNEVFATHGKIYEATAAQMFHVPIETIVKGDVNYDLRQKGKVATLALGYQGGTQALITMGALKMGLTKEELPDIVTRWREANKMITSLWYETEYAALDVVMTGIPKRIAKDRIEIALEEDSWQRFMTVKLPSGRKLYYALPTIQDNRFGKQAVHYYDVNGATKKWEATSTYGGRLVENIVQAVARDCLAVSLNRVRARGWRVVFHVHDEIVLDAPREVTVGGVCDLMSEPIEWAPGLVLKAAGFESDYYKKD